MNGPRHQKLRTPGDKGREDEGGKERGGGREGERYQVMMPLSSSSSMVGSSEILPFRRGNLHRPDGGMEKGERKCGRKDEK